MKETNASSNYNSAPPSNITASSVEPKQIDFNSSKIVYIVVAILLFVAGFLFSSWFFQQDSNLSTVSSVIIFGKVTNIDGRKLTISTMEGEGTVDISIAQSVAVYTLSSPNAPGTGEIVKGIQQLVDFSQVKVGDSISVGANFDQNGNLVGDTITIVSSLISRQRPVN